MQKWGALAVLMLASCATQKTRLFYEKEEAISRSCMAPLSAMTWEVQVKVSPGTMRSPLAEAAKCYADRVQPMAEDMRYQHRDKVYQFSTFLVNLTQAHDAGRVSTPTALQAFRQSAKEFRSAISIADEARQTKDLQEFSARLAYFAAALGAAMAAQPVGPAFVTRPITCTEYGAGTRNHRYVCD